MTEIDTWKWVKRLIFKEMAADGLTDPSKQLNQKAIFNFVEYLDALFVSAICPEEFKERSEHAHGWSLIKAALDGRQQYGPIGRAVEHIDKYFKGDL